VRVGIGQVERGGAPDSPRGRNLPSQEASPPQIARREWAGPNGQNKMAMNCPQQVKPRAWRLARCFFTNSSNSVRGKN